MQAVPTLNEAQALKPKADNRYVSYLDGFRGYAISLVVLSHFNLAKMSVAFLGVTLFFFVSGLLITRLLIFEYNRHGKINLKDFYLRRLFRLYPALIFMLLVSLAVIWLNHFQVIVPDILAGLFYFTNYYYVYFVPHNLDPNYLLVSKILWSLSVEEHFYLFFPFAFVLFFSLKNRKLLNLLTVLCLAVLITRIAVFITAPQAIKFDITYYTTHCRADSILYGCVAALLIYQHNTRWYLRLLQSKAPLVIGVLMLIFSLAFRNAFFQDTFVYTVQGIALFFVIPSLSFAYKDGWVSKVVDNKAMVFVGKLSYSLYLFHWVALKIANLYFTPYGLSWYAFVFPVTAALSLTSFYFVEKPFLSLRRKFGSNAK
ncbi:acyltransferase family protein [Foetidibacter luteolus]|uniref:acyltransferase family protein n=1 Tax=Foetidibacter luteolus TaxID=2608880 RepID=UPI00129AB43A|nr:acyltransferase [Foetidibacter luteolus]